MFGYEPFSPHHRAENAARERRHKEGEEDKERAGAAPEQAKGKQKEEGADDDDRTPFRNPFGNSARRPQQNQSSQG